MVSNLHINIGRLAPFQLNIVISDSGISLRTKLTSTGFTRQYKFDEVLAQNFTMITIKYDNACHKSKYPPAKLGALNM